MPVLPLLYPVTKTLDPSGLTTTALAPSTWSVGSLSVETHSWSPLDTGAPMARPAGRTATPATTTRATRVITRRADGCLAMTSPFVCSPACPRAGPTVATVVRPNRAVNPSLAGLGAPLCLSRHQELAQPSHAVNRTALGPGADGPKV